MIVEIKPLLLWELLSHHNIFDRIELVNHPELANYLLSLDQQALFIAGLYIDNRIPSQPTLFSAQSWKQEQERERTVQIRHEPKPSAKLQALLDKGISIEQAKIILELMK